MSEGQISTAAPEIADRFAQYLEQEGAIEAQTEVQDQADPEDGDVPAPEDEPLAASSTESEEGVDGSAEEAEATAEGDDVETIDTLTDLAKAFEVEEQDFLEHLQVPSRDGEGTVSLSDVITAYQTQPANEEESRQRVDAITSELRREHDDRLMEQQKLTAALIAQVESEPEVDWDMLRVSDPGQYLKEKEARDARRADIQRSLDSMDEEMRRRQEQSEQQHAEWQQEQVQTLYRLRPDWKDPEVGRAAMSEVTQYLQKAGYPEDQIASLEDARSILTVWRAAQWERLQAQKPEVKKRLRLLPRTLRSGAREDAAALSVERQEAGEREALRSRLSETGSVDDAAALIRGML